MTDTDRQFLRQIYQSIPTQAERDLYLKAIDGDRATKAAYIMNLASQYDIHQSEIDAFMAASALSKEDQAAIIGQVARGLIVRFFSWLGGLFGGGKK